MAHRTFHRGAQPIPDGYRILLQEVEVAGVGFRRNDAISFAISDDGWLEFAPEPTNQHDENAIQVVGCTDGFFGTKRRVIGYVPSDVALQIANSGLLGAIRPRLLKTYVGDSGFVEVTFQVLVPKGSDFDLAVSFPPEGSHYTAYVDAVRTLKREKRYDDAIALLERLTLAVEKEARRHKAPLAPWYYEQLAITYRRLGMLAKEVELLQRYVDWPHGRPNVDSKLAVRLLAARKLQSRTEA